ncbi:SGNH/GDSL hydrolase family protein [Nocardia sp. NRRL S-836]|uniref:SGNH/GDSL hydrolase family protein n=1 Tax=Nocardia sp. NRRL S-836 TaxID=1519492 RepID=UPI0006AF8750|nr:SGNH/GDSL hydrolase family protein [Nocardia sp. NRRL S-836]KOV82844.1 SGNH hydrolase [Nocardia sp. NRRL S-836]
MRRRSFLGAAATTVIAGTTTAAHASTPPRPRERWVGTWTSMPQLTEPHNMPPAPFTQDGLVLADATLRQTVRVTIGGRRMRLRFSNAFGGATLPITAVTVALPAGGRAGVSAVEPGTTRGVTFNGQSSVDTSPGALVLSDPLDFPLKAGTNLTVTTYLATGQASNDVTSHPGSRTTSHLLAGNHVDAADLPGATPTDHWYFLSGVEVLGGGPAVVVIGDSLTDGRGSTTNGNDRWPDRLSDRLRADRRTAGVAVLNQAAGGNRVLENGLGPSVLARLDRDLLAQSRVEWLILFEGVNDIGTAAADQAAQQRIADRLIAGYQQVLDRAQAHDVLVYGATLLPFGASFYDDPGGFRETARQAVNRWIRTSRRFDAVLDFDAAVRDPATPRQLLPAFDVGDHLHLNPTGYRALAEAVPTRLFG